MNSAWQNSFSNLEAILGYKFNNLKFAEEALSHPSLKQHNPDVRHYEKFEILGDAILGFVVTEMIFKSDASLCEKDIAMIKSYAVSKDIIAQIAKEINLSQYLIMTQGEENTGGKNNINNLENSTEALLAAIYLDSNSELAPVKAVIKRFWGQYIHNFHRANTDPKSYLQELTHKKFHCAPDYKLLSQTGEAHSPIFTVKLTLQNHEVTASDHSIKSAEKKAASLMLKKIETQNDQ